jgi:tRNA 5-methylaminomethyl-2-thiouridine biosynthesis bifunctional protein
MESGIDENRHIFLHHNHLAERWQALDKQSTGKFTIIETGFGSGLNFLLAWQLWQQLAPAGWQLHFVSVEKHPLHPSDLKLAHSNWPELQILAAILQHNYPPLLPGQHRRMLNSAQVCLDLLFGDAQESLSTLLDSPSRGVTAQPHQPHADAWFLDGFSPAINPEMWCAELLACIGALSQIGTTFATVTSADDVKRGLREQGFALNTVKDYSRKREILSGKMTNVPNDSALKPTSVALPWHRPATTYKAQKAIVIGAGLAGCHTAQALAKRGLQVTVIDRDNIASAASGNPQGILYTKLSPDPGALNQFTLSSFLYALTHYQILLAEQRIRGDLCGVLQLMQSAREQSQYQQLRLLLEHQDWLQFLDGEQGSQLCGLAINDKAIFYPKAGWLSPPSICAAMLDHPNIQLIEKSEVTCLIHDGSNWQLECDGGKCILSADTVVIANSNDAGQFSQTAPLAIKSIRGQLSYLPATALSQQPNCVICAEGYLAPAMDGQICLGASFNLRDKDTELRDEEHDWNLQQLKNIQPDLLAETVRPSGGRASLRCASTDYMPIVGGVPVTEAFQRDYAALSKDARSKINCAGRYHPNLYINIGHGSRGLTSTPLSAELLASYICSEIRPLPRLLCENLSPARFLIRKLKRKQIID